MTEGVRVPRRLLIAEDSPTQREVLRCSLEDAGYDVVAAPDGVRALEELGRQDFDMLISDIVMPDVDGYALCEQAKRQNPLLPVILLTSMTDPLDVVHGLQAGADNFLRKPYEFAHLLARVETILHNQKLRDSGQTQMGLELYFLNQRFMITAERQQILDLLVSTFEDLVVTNERLRSQESELASARDALAVQLAHAEAERQRLDAVMSAVPQAIVVVDADGNVTGASDAMAAFLGAPVVDALTGQSALPMMRLLHHNGTDLAFDERPLRRALSRGEPVELGRAFDLLAERADGKHVPVFVHAAPVLNADGRPTGAIGVLHELEALSLHDSLTHLPSHKAFAQEVDAAVEGSTAEGRVAAVLVVVVDRERDLRDSLGPHRIDGLAVALAERLREALELPAVRENAKGLSPAYLGGLEYAVVLPGLDDDTQAALVADGIRKHMAEAIHIEDLRLSATVTVGVSATSQPGTRAEELVPAAATAAHLGSGSGGDRVQGIDAAAAERAADRLRQEADLRRALAQGELRVHYQPIMCLDGGVTGAEALVRWQHPERGLLPPADFLGLAEDTALVVPLGWEVLRQSCRQLARWREDLPGGEDLIVSVNLAPQQLAQADVAAQVAAALQDAGLPPHALSLEITEAGVIKDTEAAIEHLRCIRATGVGISIDDFGTGYSSLLQLRTLPADTLKVDRQFVDGLLTDPDDAVIVSASISLALALRLRVVAEGVETAEQAEELRRLGCDFAQGYLWNRPLNARDFEQWWFDTGAPDDRYRGVLAAR
jgi:diguanylate cyclase (GGDEF)-like protein/PAS domain S-box-containing protein